MRLLAMENSDASVAEKLITDFLTSSIRIYGPGIISYSFHNLVHLPDDYRLHGNLDCTSAFAFESYLGFHVKNAVRAPNHAPQQIAQHLLNMNNRPLDVKVPKELDLSLDRTLKKYKGLKANKEISANNCVLFVDGRIGYCNEIQIRNNILHDRKEVFATCKVFDRPVPLFTRPIDSKTVMIFKIPDPNKVQKCTVPFNIIERKVILLPCKNYRVAIGSLHSIS